MKITFSEYQNNEINSLLNQLYSSNREEKEEKNKKLEDLYLHFEELFSKSAKYYFTNLFIEPIIYYHSIHHHYIPLFNYSFLEYYFLDQSNILKKSYIK